MRIDLPICNLKTCRLFLDGNCTDQAYGNCNYTMLVKQMAAQGAILERIKADIEEWYETGKSSISDQQYHTLLALIESAENE